MKKVSIVFLFLSIFTFGCSNKNSVFDRIDEQFKLSLKTLIKSDKISANIYMVIPRAGCSGCISDAESYMMKSIEDSTNNRFIKFILTDFDSEKILRARFGALYKSNMLILDPNNIFKSNKSLSSIYPTIYFFDEDSQLNSISEFSPTKNGINDIKKYVTENKLTNEKNVIK